MAEEIIDKKKVDEFGGLAEEAIEKQIFRRFKAKSVVAKDWIDDLVKNGYRKVRGKNQANAGLYLSDETPDIGVMSIAPSLSALLLELSLLDKDGKAEAGKSFKEVLTASKNEVLNVVVNSISKLLSECYPHGLDGGLKDVLLSSTPFYDDSALPEKVKWANGGYLDAASWVFLVADSIESFLIRMQNELPAEAVNGIKWTISVTENVINDKGEPDVQDKVYEYANKDGAMKLILEAVRKIYVECVKITCDCIVMHDKKAVGWSFRKMKNKGETADPSLYFSYVASTVYLGLYKRFNTSKDERGEKDIIDTLRKYEEMLSGDMECRKLEFYKGIAEDAALANTIKQLKKFAVDRKNKEFEKFAEFLGRLSGTERAELDFLYNTINGGEPLSYKIKPNYDGSRFYTLKRALIEFSDMLWNDGFGNAQNKVGFKYNMAKGPCFEDGSNVDMDVLPRSSRDNSFFNNLFVIGILLNAAYDAELAARDKKSGGDEYEQMLNVFQLAIQNTQRCYNEMANKGILYKIDSYILDFSERVDEDNVELSKQLRRVNMAVVPLLPLMLKSSNLMSEYVVRYPQKQMTDSLKDIIRSRKPKEGGAYWVWDKDGYNAITNYYYVDALTAFYRYYESYEAPYVDSEERIRRNELELLEAAKLEKQKELAELESRMQERIDTLKAQVDDVKSIRKSMARFIVNGLIELIGEQMTSEKLLGALDDDERENNDAVLAALKTVNSDTDTVKMTELMTILSKLQMLSLMTLPESSADPVYAAFKNADDNDSNKYEKYIKNLLGAGSSAYILRILKELLSAGIK